MRPIFEPWFSEHSHGFRAGRSAHDAVVAAQRYAEQGKDWVVDLDIAQFSDPVNHDLLMGRIAPVIRDKRGLRLRGRYLRRGAWFMAATSTMHSGRSKAVLRRYGFPAPSDLAASRQGRRAPAPPGSGTARSAPRREAPPPRVALRRWRPRRPWPPGPAHRGSPGPARRRLAATRLPALGGRRPGRLPRERRTARRVRGGRQTRRVPLPAATGLEPWRPRPGAIVAPAGPRATGGSRGTWIPGPEVKIPVRWPDFTAAGGIRRAELQRFVGGGTEDLR